MKNAEHPIIDKELNKEHTDNENTPSPHDHSLETVEEVQSESQNHPDASAKHEQEEIANLKAQIAVLEEKILRIAAEAENTRHRYEKMVDDARSYAIFNFAKDLLSVMDNLSRALEFKPQEVDEHVSNILDGVTMTKNELHSVFSKHGLETIKPEAGEKFDYNHHSAISQVSAGELEQNSIVDIMQVGYKIKDRLIRPAAVVVAK